MEVQSVTFHKNEWTPFKARLWLDNNGYKSKKLDITENMLRFRQHAPSGYTQFATKQLPNGVNFVMGKKK
jgi:hypothetical protein